MEDFGLTAEVITDSVLCLAVLDCSISQRQALSWIDIVHCMLETDVFKEREDRRSLLLQVIRRTFLNGPSAVPAGTWIERRVSPEVHSVLRRLRLKVECALQGTFLGAYKELAWLVNASVEAPQSIVPCTGTKCHIGGSTTPIGSERKKARR